MRIYKVGPCGGIGGEEKDIKDIIEKITHINQITVGYSNTCIDSITVHYQLPSGEKIVTWGKDEGSAENKATIPLQSSESITSVKGYYDGCITDNWIGLRSLTFETSFQSTYGPYGQDGGVHFELPDTGGKIIGFHGRATVKEHIDALGVYIKVGDTSGGGNTGGSTGTGSGQ